MECPLVRVEWLDATTKYEQMSFEEAIQKCKLEQRHTVGYLVLKDTERILLAHTIDFDGVDGKINGGTDFTSIPRHWATIITLLQDDGELGKEKK